MKSTFIWIQTHVYILSEAAEMIKLLPRDFLSKVLRHLILARWAVYRLRVHYGRVLGLEYDPNTLLVVHPMLYTLGRRQDTRVLFRLSLAFATCL